MPLDAAILARDLAHLVMDASNARVSYGAAADVPAILDVESVDVFDEDRGVPVRQTQHTLTIVAGALPGLRRGVAITVSGTAWTVTGHNPIDDGGLTRITLGRG